MQLWIEAQKRRQGIENKILEMDAGVTAGSAPFNLEDYESLPEAPMP